jgi:hypothetical protein
MEPESIENRLEEIREWELEAEGDVCVYRPPKVRRICGVIVDPVGRPIPHEKVSVLKKETLLKDTTTDDAGEFDFEGIAAGKYELDVDILGFRHARYELTLLRPTGSCRHAIRVQMYIGMHCVPDIKVMNHPKVIFSAASAGDLQKAKTLIEDDPDVIFSEDNEGRAPLYLAATHGQKDMAALLVADGAYVNDWDNNGMTPLHGAAENGHKAVTELLLAKKAEINVLNDDGKTPLHLAAEYGRKDVVALLLAKKANVNTEDNNDHTPLHLAIANDHKSVVELLRQHGGHE